jgi:5-methylcytosine-specific restriction endonuclease McrA
MARLLAEFKQRTATCSTKAERLALLQDFAERRIESGDGPRQSSPHHRRARFEVRKNRGAYDCMGAFCWVCRDPSEVRHHVVQLQHGGRNRKDNIVVLCRVCHALVHPWMELPKD